MAYELWPATLDPNHADWHLVGNGQTFLNPLTGDEQDLPLPGARWAATLTFSNVTGVKARTLRAFIATLCANSGRCWLPVHDAVAPGGTAAGSGLVALYGQTGLTLATKGWDADQAQLFQIGDYVQVGSELHMLSADVASAADGTATLPLVRPIRSSPLVGDAVVTSRPAALMKLADRDQARWAVSPPTLYAASISFIEVLNG